jgi:3-methyladenine DNA glycosylase AlkD
VTADEVLDALRAEADASRLTGMARVGIETSHALGVSLPAIRKIAKKADTDQRLAQALWGTEIHEARMVAALVADPTALSFRAMGVWAGDLDSWDVTDLVADTFVRTAHADRAIRTWSRARHGFTKRCAFSMLARLAVGHTDEPDPTHLGYLPLIHDAATDGRNEVRRRSVGRSARSASATTRLAKRQSRRRSHSWRSATEPRPGSRATRSVSCGTRRPSRASRADGHRLAAPCNSFRRWHVAPRLSSVDDPGPKRESSARTQISSSV